MEFEVGMSVYFKGIKCTVVDKQFPIGTYEVYKVRNREGELFRAFRYEITKLEEIEELMAESDDEHLLALALNMEEPETLPSQTVRFAQTSADRLKLLATTRLEESTVKQTKWGIKVFRDWLRESQISIGFEHVPTNDLNSLLRQFYAGARTKKGKLYSKSALIGIRSAINRHLTSPPFEKTLNLSTDKDFMTSNHVLMGVLKEQRRAGKDVTRHHEPISPGDLKLLYSSGTLSNENPTSLVRKVSLHLGRRGREGLRNLRADSFIIRHDDTGAEYVEMAYNEYDKTHKGVDSREQNKHPRMYSSQCPDLCPVASIKLYLLKRNIDCPAFFQRPLSKWLGSNNWYGNQPLGAKTLGNLMPDISKEAGLSRRYTNHCVRATTATLLADAGVSVIDLMSVTGHRNEASVRSYVTKPSVEKRREISTILQQISTQASVSSSSTDNSVIPARDFVNTSTSVSQYSLRPESFGGLFQNASISNSTVTLNINTSGQ